MLATIRSCALLGIEALPVAIEVSVGGGLPGYHVVGLPTPSIKEGAVRIRAALEQLGGGMPRRKVTVNLAPADRRKEGAAFDLPIALGILAADGALDAAPLAGLMVVGELALSGELRPVRGALSAAILARQLGMRGILLPACSAAEAAEVDGLEVFAADHIEPIIDALTSGESLPRWHGDSREPRPENGSEDMADVRGQESARLALEIAVAGGHNVLMLGPPGIGKSMLAKRLPSILPELSRDEALETTRVHSAASLSQQGLVTTRPFRCPHHTISTAALVGGGAPPRPGEVSLAHNGVLFLDELPEFRRSALEALRQPLEDRQVLISRAQASVLLPASFFLIAAANPCPCGWFGISERVCTCSNSAIARYRGRLSGPLLDRIDLQVKVTNVGIDKMRCAAPGESSAAIRARVEECRVRQRQRLAAFGARTNADMSAKALRATCTLTDGAEAVLRKLHRKRQLSGRSVDRLIRVSRTIADLDGCDVIDQGHLLDAADYRLLDAEPSTLNGTFFGPSASGALAGSDPG